MMTNFTILSLLLVVITVIYEYCRRRVNYFKQIGIPHIPPWPIVGNMGPALFGKKHISEIIQEAYDTDADAKYVGFYDFMSPVILIRDLELVKSLFVTNFENYTDHRPYIDDAYDPMYGKGIFYLQGEKWRELRNLLNPAFSSKKLKTLFSHIVQHAQRFVNFIVNDSVDSEKPYDLKDIFTKFTTDVVGTCVFSLEVDSMKNPNNDFHVYAKEANKVELYFAFKLFAWRAFPTLMKIFKIKIISDKVRDFFNDVIGGIMDERDKNNTPRPDIIQYVFDARKKMTKYPLSFNEITAQALVFLVGGSDSSSTLMCFMGHELALHSHVQQKLQNEIDEVMERTGGKITYEDIGQMRYLDAVVTETNRRHMGTFLERLCVKDNELPPALPNLKPFMVKAGMSIWFHVQAIHGDKKYYEDPHSFHPERFMGEKANKTIFSFGQGPRICIGYKFAIWKTKVLFFYLLSKCNLRVCGKTNTTVPLELDKAFYSKTPDGGFWIKIEPREI